MFNENRFWAMFETLNIHLCCTPTIYAELLIGESPLSNMPPSYSDPILKPLCEAGAFGEVRNATTEIVYGAGQGSEYAHGRNR